jgi:hypothetical protein
MIPQACTARATPTRRSTRTTTISDPTIRAVESAAINGSVRDSTYRTISTGRVAARGPATNSEITVSSNDSRKESAAQAIRPGAASGSVTRRTGLPAGSAQRRVGRAARSRREALEHFTPAWRLIPKLESRTVHGRITSTKWTDDELSGATIPEPAGSNRSASILLAGTRRSLRNAGAFADVFTSTSVRLIMLAYSSFCD